MNLSTGENVEPQSDRRRKLAKAKRLAQKVRSLMDTRRYHEAIQIQHEVVALRINDSGEFHLLGMLYRELYRYELAVDAFRQAKKLDPAHCVPREALVDALVDASRYTEAIDECKDLIQVSPANTFARHILSIVYFQLGNVEQALDMTVEIASLDPFDGHNYLRRATLYEHRGEYKKALQSYGRALDHAETDSMLYEEIMESIETLDDTQTRIVLLLATEDKMFALKLHKDVEFALVERGFSLSRDGIRRLRAVLSDQDFSEAFISPNTQQSGSWYYN